MPTISVRSMSSRQRRRHSLSAKTFRTTALSCAAMGLVSLLLGLVIYTFSMADQYISHAVQLATIARSSAIKGADGMGLADRVMEKYRSLTEEQRAETGTEAYRAIFAEELETRDYDVLIHMLGNYLTSEYVFDVYLAMYDEQSCAMVYVVDPEESGRLCPGEWESVTEHGMRKFLDWDGTGRLYDIDYTSNYGWLCTAGLPLRDESGVIHCFLLVDIDVRNLIAGIRGFSLSLGAAMLVLTALIAWMITRHMKRTTVRPIIDISKAAEAYTADRKAGNTATKHFAALDIHTGDEVENLSLTMADMEQSGPEPQAKTDAPQPEIPDKQSGSGEELILPARVENLERVQSFVADRLGGDCSPKDQMQLELAVEEIFVNIASYAYTPGEGQAAIRVERTESPASVTLIFRDSGVPYNPLAREDPDVEVLAGERQIGGLGIFLTKQVMDELHYAYQDGQNVLTMKKLL